MNLQNFDENILTQLVQYTLSSPTPLQSQLPYTSKFFYWFEIAVRLGEMDLLDADEREAVLLSLFQRIRSDASPEPNEAILTFIKNNRNNADILFSLRMLVLACEKTLYLKGISWPGADDFRWYFLGLPDLKRINPFLYCIVNYSAPKKIEEGLHEIFSSAEDALFDSLLNTSPTLLKFYLNQVSYQADREFIFSTLFSHLYHYAQIKLKTHGLEKIVAILESVLPCLGDVVFISNDDGGAIIQQITESMLSSRHWQQEAHEKQLDLKLKIIEYFWQYIDGNTLEKIATKAIQSLWFSAASSGGAAKLLGFICAKLSSIALTQNQCKTLNAGKIFQALFKIAIQSNRDGHIEKSDIIKSIFPYVLLNENVASEKWKGLLYSLVTKDNSCAQRESAKLLILFYPYLSYYKQHKYLNRLQSLLKAEKNSLIRWSLYALINIVHQYKSNDEFQLLLASINNGDERVMEVFLATVFPEIYPCLDEAMSKPYVDHFILAYKNPIYHDRDPFNLALETLSPYFNQSDAETFLYDALSLIADPNALAQFKEGIDAISRISTCLTEKGCKLVIKQVMAYLNQHADYIKEPNVLTKNTVNRINKILIDVAQYLAPFEVNGAFHIVFDYVSDYPLRVYEDPIVSLLATLSNALHKDDVKNVFAKLVQYQDEKLLLSVLIIIIHNIADKLDNDDSQTAIKILMPLLTNVASVPQHAAVRESSSQCLVRNSLSQLMSIKYQCMLPTLSNKGDPMALSYLYFEHNYLETILNKKPILNMLALDSYMLLNIFSYLGESKNLAARTVCKKFSDLISLERQDLPTIHHQLTDKFNLAHPSDGQSGCYEDGLFQWTLYAEKKNKNILFVSCRYPLGQFDSTNALRFIAALAARYDSNNVTVFKTKQGDHIQFEFTLPRSALNFISAARIPDRFQKVDKMAKIHLSKLEQKKKTKQNGAKLAYLNQIRRNFKYFAYSSGGVLSENATLFISGIQGQNHKTKKSITSGFFSKKTKEIMLALASIPGSDAHENLQNSFAKLNLN